MTQKEKLYCEYMRLRNELNSLNGLKETCYLETDGSLMDIFKGDIACHSIKELNSLITSMSSKLDEEHHKIAIKDWYATPDGIRYKASIIRRREELKQEQQKITADAEKYVSQLIKLICGEKWAVIRISLGWNGFLSIGIVEKEENGSKIAYFGKEFELSFKTHYILGNELEEFNMNYASNGAFDVIKDPISCEFVRGMGRFLSNRYTLQELKNYLHSACKKAEAITNELYDLSKKEKEPEIVARQSQNQKKSVANK